MTNRTGFIDITGSGKDLSELYETRITGITDTTHYVSHTYGMDLGSIFFMNTRFGVLGLSGSAGSNCGYKTLNGKDVGSLLCVKGTVVSTSSPNFNSLTFNGINQQASLGDTAYYADAGNAGLTIEIWFKTSLVQTDANIYATLFSKPTQYGLYINNNKLTYYNWPNVTVSRTGFTVNDGLWHHAALVLNSGGGANSSSLYYDGVKAFDFSMTYQNSGIFYIGGNGQQFFTGNISFLRIWNTRKDAAFMATNYNRYLNPTLFSDMIGFYSFSEGSGTTIANSSFNNNYSFTLQNAPTWSSIIRPPVTPSTNITVIENLFQGVSISPWGIYDAALFRGSTLPEARGNGRNATSTGTITTSTGSGNGATASIPSISGGISSTMTWPALSIPNNFTICGITRYTNNSANQQRILTSTLGSTQNFLLGHYNTSYNVPASATGMQGLAYYNGNWRTSTTGFATQPTKTNWLVSCAKASATTNANTVIMNRIAVGTSTGGSGNNGTLGINVFSGNQELSEWSFSYLVIYDSVLTDAQMTTVSNKLTLYKYLGNFSEKSGIYDVYVYDRSNIQANGAYFINTIQNVIFILDCEKINWRLPFPTTSTASYVLYNLQVTNNAPTNFALYYNPSNTGEYSPFDGIGRFTYSGGVWSGPETLTSLPTTL